MYYKDQIPDSKMAPIQYEFKDEFEMPFRQFYCVTVSGVKAFLSQYHSYPLGQLPFGYLSVRSPNNDAFL